MKDKWRFVHESSTAETVDRRRFEVRLHGHLELPGVDAADRAAIAESHIDDVMANLIVAHAVDPMIGATFHSLAVEVGVTVEATTEVGAKYEAAVVLRRAIVDAGGMPVDKVGGIGG